MTNEELLEAVGQMMESQTAKINLTMKMMLRKKLTSFTRSWTELMKS